MNKGYFGINSTTSKPTQPKAQNTISYKHTLHNNHSTINHFATSKKDLPINKIYETNHKRIEEKRAYIDNKQYDMLIDELHNFLNKEIEDNTFTKKTLKVPSFQTFRGILAQLLHLYDNKFLEIEIDHDGICDLQINMGYPFVIQRNMFKALGAPNNWQHCVNMQHWLAMLIREEKDMISQDSITVPDDNSDGGFGQNFRTDSNISEIAHIDYYELFRKEIEQDLQNLSLQTFLENKYTTQTQHNTQTENHQHSQYETPQSQDTISAKIDNKVKDVTEELDNLNNEIDKTSEIIDLLKSSEPSISELLTHIKTCELDLAEFEDKISIQKINQNNFGMDIDSVQNEVSNYDTYLMKTDREIKELEHKLSDQTLTKEEGDQLLEEIKEKEISITTMKDQIFAQENLHSENFKEHHVFKLEIDEKWDKSVKIFDENCNGHVTEEIKANYHIHKILQQLYEDLNSNIFSEISYSDDMTKNWSNWKKDKDIVNFEKWIRDSCIQMDQKRFTILRELGYQESDLYELVERKSDHQTKVKNQEQELKDLTLKTRSTEDFILNQKDNFDQNSETYRIDTNGREEEFKYLVSKLEDITKAIEDLQMRKDKENKEIVDITECLTKFIESKLAKFNEHKRVVSDVMFRVQKYQQELLKQLTEVKNTDFS